MGPGRHAILLPASTEAIRNAPTPRSTKDVRSFLGSVNYLREFIPNLSGMTEPLHKLTRTAEAATFSWSPESETAFGNIKSILGEHLKLLIFEPNRPTILSTDASNIGL